MDGHTQTSVCIFMLCWIGLINCADFKTNFMDTSCNVNLGQRVSGRLETSLTLLYDDDMDCYTTVSVQEGHRILLYFLRFDVEGKLDGKCTDIFNAHDGSSVDAPIINEEPLCDEIKQVFTLKTSSNKVTLHFTTDNDANFKGFDIIYTEFTDAPCGAGDFACNNSICINEASRCNGINECGDRSDEEFCDVELAAELEEDAFPLGLVIGCSIGGLILIIILIVVIYRVYDYYYWQKWLDRNDLRDERVHESVYVYEYPVTDRYDAIETGEKHGRRKPDINPLFLHDVKGQEGERYIDEY